MSATSPLPKYGTVPCQATYGSGKMKGQGCRNMAYFEYNGRYLCGVHCKAANRTELTKMTATESKTQKDGKTEVMWESAKLLAQVNAKSSKQGDIVLVKMVGMFPRVAPRSGYLNVYPNFKSNWQGIGVNLPQLSPMSLGPVNHGQPGLPPACNIENFHQGSKLYAEEEKDGSFVPNRLKFYRDPVPHRHKFAGAANAPLYFVWLDAKEVEHHLTYVESRQFYCNFYERLVQQQAGYTNLCKLVNDGYNLQICGPDAYPMGVGGIDKTYQDPSHPFGHERVLYTMLTQPEASWPWRVHKTFAF